MATTTPTTSSSTTTTTVPAMTRRFTTRILRIPLLCVACLLLLKLDVSTLHRSLHSSSLSSLTTSNKSSKNHHIDKNDNHNNDIIGDVHASHVEVLDLLQWEQDSFRELLQLPANATPVDLQQTCQPPPGVSTTCCLGTFSTGGGVTDKHRYQCIPPFQKSSSLQLNSTRGTATASSRTMILQDLRQDTLAFFRDNPLMTMAMTLTREEEEEEEEPAVVACDMCRIVELARQQNLTIALMGDSMHSQVMEGLMCELQRRKYNVSSQIVDHNPQQDPTYPYRRHALSQILHIQSPTWKHKQDAYATPTVTINFHRMYLLPLINDAVLDITKQTDVVILGFGLHWWYSNHGTTLLSKRRESYVTAMRDLFTNITNQGRVQLMIHRETSAQHFDAPGGEFSLWYHQRDKRSKQCQPIHNLDSSNANNNYNDGNNDDNDNDDVFLWREQAIQKAANQSGHALIVAGPYMPPYEKNYNDIGNHDNDHPFPLPLSSSQSSSSSTSTTRRSARERQQQHPKEVVVLPYLDFTSRHSTLHPVQQESQDCTHFCSSPYMYYPLWRSLRFAMERQFG